MPIRAQAARAATLPPSRPMPLASGERVPCRPTARWKRGKMRPTCSSQWGNWSIGIQTPEKKARMTTVKGAIVEAASTVGVKGVRAIPSVQRVAVPSVT
jgi:hypothetical protein